MKPKKKQNETEKLKAGNCLKVVNQAGKEEVVIGNIPHRIITHSQPSFHIKSLHSVQATNEGERKTT